MFDIGNLILGIASTLIPFYWIFKLKDYSSKIYFGVVVLFLFIYSGAGVGLIGVHDLYWLFYLIYAISISLGIYLSRWNKKVNINKKTSFKLTYIIDKYGNTIILVFLLLNIATLLYPHFLLHKLLAPPLPDSDSNFFLRFENIDITFYERIIYYSIQILTPFFYLALFKYRSKPIHLLILLIISPYITYCREAYIGRGVMIMLLFIYIITIYRFKPQYRKTIILVLIFTIPTIAAFLLYYGSIRIGGDGNIISNQSAIQQIIYAETSFPLWFSKIYNRTFEFDDFINYIMWILTLPFPGFLKGDFSPQGYAISELLLGVNIGQKNFYVLLPGMVGESVYHFGKSFFWCHGLIMGLLVGKVYKYLKKHHQLYILFLYTTFQMGYMLNRGGSASAYPFILKHLIYFYIIIYLLTNYKFLNAKNNF